MSERDYEYSKGKLVYDYYFHESERVNSRVEWFLIFHGILLEAYFSIHHNHIIESVIVAFLGTICSFMWLFNGLRANWIIWQLGNRMSDPGKMQDLANENDDIFSERKEKLGDKYYGWATHLSLYSIVLPAILLIVWELLFLVFLLNKGHYYLAPVLFLSSVALMYLISKTTAAITANFSKFKRKV